MKNIYLVSLLISIIGCISQTKEDKNIELAIRRLNSEEGTYEEKDKFVTKLNSMESNFPYYQEFDTLKYLKKLNLKIEVDKTHFANSEKLDTFTLKYMAFACLCPQWLILDSVPNQNPFRDGFYLENGTSGLNLPNIFRAGTVITFIGKVEDNRSSEKYKSQEITPGKELYFYYYKIHKPFLIWGESVFQSYNIDIFTDAIKKEYMSRTITIE